MAASVLQKLNINRQQKYKQIQSSKANLSMLTYTKSATSPSRKIFGIFGIMPPMHIKQLK
jgi:hypothetical protein